MKTIVISGSIRSRQAHSDYIFSRVSEVDTLDEYVEDMASYLEKTSGISNSDILSGAVLMAMKAAGADFDYYPIMKLFPKRERRIAFADENSLDAELATKDTLALDDEEFADLRVRIASANGVVLVSPVYFGDRSSVANKFLQLSGMHNLLDEKVFGAVSVGAKRNGGQETTVIYSLFEALNQNALVVGNGPPTSQYGGTAVGGKKGTVLKDEWGLETSYGTGSRVAEVSRIVEVGRDGPLGRPIKILVLVTMDDTKQILRRHLEVILAKAAEELPNARFHVEYVLDSTIHRCLGCDKCPASGTLLVGTQPNKDHRAHCAIKNPDDAMERIHELMLESDGIIVAGLNVKQHDQLLYRYQALTERTRYIRRDHFELTNKLMTSFSLTQVGARINSLHSLKTLTSYIRHNSIMHKPIESFIYNGNILDDGVNELVHFAKLAEIIAVGKSKVEPKIAKYTTEGIGGY